MPNATPLPFTRDASGPFAGIGVLTLEQPGKPVVVLDLALIQRLEASLKSLPIDLRGLVLASASERVFVAGADLKAISELNDDELFRYLQYGSRVFGMLAQLPYPTAAAINGAALGGGLELAMHCDALIAAPGAKPYPVGLPEAGLSICPGWGGSNLLAARIDPADAIRRTASGKPLMFDDAKAAGMFDALADSPAALLDVAKQWVADAARAGMKPRPDGPARTAGRSPWAPKALAALNAVRDEVSATDSGRAVAAAVQAGIDRGWPAALEVEQRELVRLRNSPAGKAAIQAFFEKSAKR
ncbi:Short-chain-enoyl-CoA hydratase [Phycisphaerales bacterium]|nr:Short-chain-enoyl-CoA hydratase [Phycisphaerales bacterium]